MPQAEINKPNEFNHDKETVDQIVSVWTPQRLQSMIDLYSSHLPKEAETHMEIKRNLYLGRLQKNKDTFEAYYNSASSESPTQKNKELYAKKVLMFMKSTFHIIPSEFIEIVQKEKESISNNNGYLDLYQIFLFSINNDHLFGEAYSSFLNQLNEYKKHEPNDEDIFNPSFSVIDFGHIKNIWKHHNSPVNKRTRSLKRHLSFGEKSPIFKITQQVK